MVRSKKGFTLIELIVVLAILAIIAAIAVPTAFGAIDSARKSADSASVDSVNSAIRVYAALDLSSGEVDPDATVKDALDDAGMTIPVFQFATSAATWVPNTNTEAPGHYTWAETGTKAIDGTQKIYE